ncbi:YciI family protein [Pelagibaculum spongiae]|uniref:YCII-related domain-containing protein n=1 Tax=Pelagibaculum spongiae TaxID=2080658 RepID=A0A2V1H038_9GAMM|nr:YciI family protein [Pelagibaculum spongiae]PVZ68971.1 hypothetical protein DC094_12055 [Pelagibaculum spongiae]
MFYIVLCRDNPSKKSLRVEHESEHHQWLREQQHPVMVRLSGPLLNQEENSKDGSLLVLDADSLDVVEKFAYEDPFQKVGLYEEIVIKPWPWGIGLALEGGLESDPL